MSDMLDFSALLLQGGRLRNGRVLGITDAGLVEVELSDAPHSVSCRVLQTSPSGISLAPGNDVLLWLREGEPDGGVVFGRVGLYVDPAASVVPSAEMSKRPEELVLEAKGEIVLRNRHARIRLSADGDIEIVGTSLTSRSQRLMRLLAPLIKLN